MGRSYGQRDSTVTTMDEAASTATTAHVHYCFDTLVQHLRDGSSPRAPPPFPDALCPLFVTWNTVSSSPRGHRMRGCIGTLEPRQLYAALGDYALTSALHDKRFQPIPLSEVPSLSCTVSLLARFEVAASWDDWTVGVHGLIIVFVDPDTGSRRTATFLPCVAAEQGWTRTQTIDSLIQKAGHLRPPSATLRGALHVTRYQSTAASASYDDYLAASSAAGAAAGATHGGPSGARLGGAAAAAVAAAAATAAAAAAAAAAGVPAPAEERVLVGA